MMEELLDQLLQYLLSEKEEYQGIQLPDSFDEKFRLYRSLVNVRLPKPIDLAYLKIQNEFLHEYSLRKGIITLKDMEKLDTHIYLYKGDITRLQVDAIVNAANAQMLGCFVPCHGCIDNAIHTFAGIKLREECANIMRIQGHDEPCGSAKITKAYQLPSKYILHTVGPIVYGKLTMEHKEQLASCYRSVLQLAYDRHLRSVAFCCISTGEFHFPNEEAARIAVAVVKTFLKTHEMEVIFNVFKQEDETIYHRLLTSTKDDEQLDSSS